VSCSCALAAVGLADLLVLSVGDLLQVLSLDSLDSLLEALSLTSTQARKSRECAWAGEVSKRKGRLCHIGNLGTGIGSTSVLLNESVVETTLEAFCGNDSDAEGNEEEASHFDFAVVVIYI